jgi:Fe-Mn family superoxide dismutase
MKTFRLPLLYLLCIPFVLPGQFKLPPLDYAYNALEPFIDEQTMQIHHTRHHQGYVDNLNKAIAGTPAEKLSIEEILKNISRYSEAVRNNAGGHYNHAMFWQWLTPGGSRPSSVFLQAVEKKYGSLDSLKKLISKEGMSRFGSGWVWLILNEKKELQVCSTPNQDNPLMDIAPVKGIPILGIDVWEHAYYLKYQNKRGDYLANIWNVINWKKVSELYEKNK